MLLHVLVDTYDARPDGEEVVMGRGFRNLIEVFVISRLSGAGA
jgi:hypothetical protein